MGMVSVRPGKLPAKVIVAPNSPRARAQHNTAPAPRDGAIMGTVTRRNTVIRVAPRVAAASSKPWSAERSAPSTVMIRNGIATKVSAITTATGEKGIVTPNQEYRYLPSKPVRPNASSNATPPTTGGSTSGSVTSARNSRCPAKLPRASTHASGTPMITAIAVAADAVHSDSTSAWTASEPLSTAASRCQGTRNTSPASGSTRNAIATIAGASSGAGADLDPPPRSTRRARSRVLSRDGVASASIGVWAAGRSGLLELGCGQQAFARGRHDVGDERPRGRRVAALADRGDWVHGRRVDPIRDRHALHLCARGVDVGHVDDARVDVAEFDLAKDRFHIRLERDRRDGDPGVAEHFRGDGTARHLRLAQRNLHR